MNPYFIIPSSIDSVIQHFDKLNNLFTISDVSTALEDEKQKLDKINLSTAENLGLQFEILAFGLEDAFTNGKYDPWKSFFRPIFFMKDPMGVVSHFPNLKELDSQIITHWKKRASTLKHPVLKARYADLAWELEPLVTSRKRDIQMIKIAIDSYIKTGQQFGLSPIKREQYNYLIRAMDLASKIKAHKNLEVAYNSLFSLYIKDGNKNRLELTYQIYDHLTDKKFSNFIDKDKRILIADLEQILSLCANATPISGLYSFHMQAAGERLIKYYQRTKRVDEIRRIYKAIAESHSSADSKDALLDINFLNISIHAYKEAGLFAEAEELRIILEQKIQKAHSQMKTIPFRYAINSEEAEKFLSNIISNNPTETLFNIAEEFLLNKKFIEKNVLELTQNLTISATFQQSLLAKNHMCAKVGAVREDPYGHLITQAGQILVFRTPWLKLALERAIKYHNLAPDYFIACCKSSKLFDDNSCGMIYEGLCAWYEGDDIKAIHVLVPQIEYGTRAILKALGKPITKQKRDIAHDISIVLSMGDILNNQDNFAELEDFGENLRIHLLTLYSDPRGLNLRNNLAHGMLKLDDMNKLTTAWLVHTLLLFIMFAVVNNSNKTGANIDR